MYVCMCSYIFTVPPETVPTQPVLPQSFLPQPVPLQPVPLQPDTSHEILNKKYISVTKLMAS